MKSPQKENGFTSISNELFEAILKTQLGRRELIILLAIIRKTYGFQKKEDKISLSQFVKMTSISKSNICHTLKQLEAKLLIIIDKNDRITSYKINKNYDNWIVKSGTIQNDNEIGYETTIDRVRNDNKVGYETTHTKESKETIQKKLLQKKISNASVADINPLIKLFEPINPSYKKLFANTTQRKALQGVVSSMGFEKTEQVLKLLPKTNGMQYAPVITTPLQFEQKLGQLIAFLQKENNKKVIGVAI